jgi:uncharacterized protein (DUF4415 family)
VSFEAAKLVFDDPLHISRQDRTEDGEPRWQTIGMVGDVALLLVAHTCEDSESDGELVRIISARRATSWRGKFMSKIPKSIRKELAALAAKPETKIDLSDIPATGERDWRGAERGKFYRPIKRQLTVRIDADVIEWLKSQGRGYQSRLNEILRAAMLAKLRHR